MKKYKRMQQATVIGGVLSGFAYYFNVKSLNVRYIYFLTALGLFLWNVKLCALLILMYIMICFLTEKNHQDPEDYQKICEPESIS